MTKVYRFEGEGTAISQGAAATPTNTGALSLNTTGGAIIFDTASARQGSYGLKLTTSASNAIQGVWANEAQSLNFSYTTEIQIPTPLPSGANVPTIWSARWKDPGGTIGTSIRVLVAAGGVTTMTTVTGASIPLGTRTAGEKLRLAVWGTVATSSTGELHMRLYTTGTNTQVATAYNSTTRDLGTNTHFAAILGFSAPTEVHTLSYDSHQSSTTVAELPELPANLPPTVSVGSDITLGVSGGAVTLTATASDPDGSIASYAWSFHSILPASTAPTITNAATANASVTVANPGRYVIKCIVTDNGGATATAYKKAFVPAATAIRPILDVGNPGGFSINGGASSASGALADESDTTLNQGPTAPASEALLDVLMAPMVTPTTAFSFDLKHKLAAAGTVTTKVRLLEATVSALGVVTASTQRKEWTVSPTTTAATASLTLTAPEIATVTQWNEIVFRFSEV